MSAWLRGTDMRRGGGRRISLRVCGRLGRMSWTAGRAGAMVWWPEILAMHERRQLGGTQHGAHMNAYMDDHVVLLSKHG